jgi:voltage-gated potassium channel
LQRPAKKIIETIEYNLEQMDDLTVEELELLKKTTDTLIVHMEKVKAAAERKQQAQQRKAD